MPVRPRAALLVYLLVAYAASWLVWAPLCLATWRGQTAWPYLHLLGGMGPALAALIAARLEGPARWRALLDSLSPARLTPRWLALTVAGPILLYAIALGFLRALGQDWPRWSDLGASREYPALPRALYWLANVVCYGYGEELGWRGFLLPALRRRRGPIAAALLVSVLWAGWHLPLFGFAAGMRAMGPGEVLGWYASLAVGSILLTWIYEASGSVAAVALFHGVLDIVIGTPGSPMAANATGAALTVLGVAVIVFGRRRWRAAAAA